MHVRAVSRNAIPVLGGALAVYALWALATWWFEGRLGLLQRPDPVARGVYVLVANLLVGLGASTVLLRRALRTGAVQRFRLGLRGWTATLAGTGIALVVGFLLLLALRPATLQPVALLNGFAQVLPTTIAEVVVCWMVVGGLTWAVAERSGLGRVPALVLAVVAADVTFGVYHFAHSAPFNTWQMSLFLMLPGLLTSAVFFGTRNVWAAVVIHNALGMKGVMDAADLTAFGRPLYPLLGLALLAVLALAAMHAHLRRFPERYEAKVGAVRP